MKKFAAIAVLIFTLFADSFAETAEKVVSFDRKIHDFGDILISDGAVTCLFTFTNVSNSPIVIHNVVSSCGCTTPDWTREPILPGQNGTINARFSNDQGEGAFDKSLTVYISNVDRPVILRLRGYSHKKEKDITKMYDVLAGPIGLRKTVFSLGYLDQGAAKEDYVQIANTGKSAVEISAVEVSEGLTVSFEPERIEGRQLSKMTYSVDLSRITPQIWGRNSFSFKLCVNGKTQPVEIRIDAMIKDNFGGLTKTDLASCPKLTVDKSYFEFGQITKGQILQESFTIRNKGKKTLKLYAIDPQTPGSVTSDACPVLIPSGESYDLRIKFDSSKINGTGEIVDVISIVTNDPDKPILNLFISGIIE